MIRVERKGCPLSSAPGQNANCQRGFSLIELIVVLAMIAILGTLAYPSYVASIYKSRRTEGRMLLQTAAVAQERYYASRSRYTAQIGADGLAISTDSEPGHFYSLAKIELGEDAQTFVLVATPSAAQEGDLCGSLTLDSSGRRGVKSESTEVADNCW